MKEPPRPYNGEVTYSGCETCGVGRAWSVHFNDEPIGHSYGTEEDADDLSAILNKAYANGWRDRDETTAQPPDVLLSLTRDGLIRATFPDLLEASENVLIATSCEGHDLFAAVRKLRTVVETFRYGDCPF